MNEKQITDIESYKAITGAKRFKRTKEEIALGLSPEEALKRRVNPGIIEAPANRSPKVSGDIVIRIRPMTGTDADYFEFVPQSEVVVEVDEHWYKWLDTRATVPYNGDVPKLIADLINLGMNEVVNKHGL